MWHRSWPALLLLAGLSLTACPVVERLGERVGLGGAPEVNEDDAASGSGAESPALEDESGEGPTPPPPLESHSKRIDVEQGGVVEGSGASVTVPAGSGTGTAEVTIARAKPSKRPEDGDAQAALTDVWSIEMRDAKGREVQPSRVRIRIPLHPGLDMDRVLAGQPRVLTRASADDAWKALTGEPRVDPKGRWVQFEVDHLSLYMVVLNWLRDPNMKFYYSYTDRFRIDYPLKEVSGRKWTPLTKRDKDVVAPPLVEDVGEYLDAAYAHLTSIKVDGRTLFPAAPEDEVIRVRLGRVSGGDAGDCGLGGVPVYDYVVLANDRSDVAVVTAHELVHHLQDRYYNKLGAFANTVLVEATADLYARRAAGPLQTDAYWFHDASGYLERGLLENTDGNKYAVAHFLNWLEQRTGAPVVGRMLLDHDHAISDKAALEAAVNAAAKPKTFGELFVEYARVLHIGTPEYQSPKIVALDHSLPKKRTLWAEYAHPNAPTSAIHLKVKTRATTRPGLLVLDGCSIPGAVQVFTFDQGAKPHEALELQPTQTTMMRKECARAIVDMGTRRTEIDLVVVTPGLGAGKSEHRFWLLLPPTDVRYDRLGTQEVQWKHDDSGFPKGALGYKVYASDELLHEGLVHDKKLKVGKLTPDQERGLWVAVVDKHGFEWPLAPEPGKCPSCDSLAKCCAAVSDKTSKLICNEAHKTLTGKTCDDRSCAFMLRAWRDDGRCP